MGKERRKKVRIEKIKKRQKNKRKRPAGGVQLAHASEIAGAYARISAPPKQICYYHILFISSSSPI